MRSASPCDNQHSRAPYVNDLIEAANVNVILDLSTADLSVYAREYLKSGGMTDEEIELFLKRITE